MNQGLPLTARVIFDEQGMRVIFDEQGIRLLNTHKNTG